MIFQLVLSVSLVSILFYFLLTKRRPAFVTAVVIAVSASGLLFVWRPEFTTDIATRVGIGRGADMIIYSWLVISYALILNQQVRLRKNHEMMTVLAREVAIANAQRPAVSSGSVGAQSAAR